VPGIIKEPRPISTESPHPIGALVPGNANTSKLEQQVRQRLMAAGVELHEEQVGIQCGLHEARGKYPVLTPDFLILGAKVCIEIDPENTHSDRLEQDRVRNELLSAAGWRVVRLRLGGLEAIGDGDVVSDAGGVTAAATSALVEAIADAVAGRPGVIRTVKRKPATPRKKSRLGAIREDQYQDNLHNVAWILATGEKLSLAVVNNGRYLGRRNKSEFPQFVRQLDLQGVPTDQWRKILEPLFENMSASEFDVVSTFPWGDSLFIGPQADSIRLGEKFNPVGPSWSFTANLEGVEAYNTAIIEGADGDVVVELHGEALALGWELHSVQLRTGRHGDYQEIILIRKGPEA
jgi:very-short-patch-repair endonuclease